MTGKFPEDGFAVFEATMSRLDEVFTVGLLASRLEIGEGLLNRKATKAEILSAGQRNGFTSILLGEFGSDGSIAASEVVRLDDSRRDIQSRRRIDSPDCIPGDTTIVQGLERMVTHSFLLVGGPESVTSILTPADFNKLPVRTLLCSMLSRLENLLDGEIQSSSAGTRKDRWMRHLKPAARKKLEDRIKQRKSKDRELSALSCAYLSDKLLVATKIKAIRVKLGTSPEGLALDARELIRLRNDVAHGRDVVAGRLDLPEPDPGLGEPKYRSGITVFRDRVLRLKRWISALSPTA